MGKQNYYMNTLREAWKRTDGKAWEPPQLSNPIIGWAIEEGYLKRCTMRCGFEAMDTGVTWTEAGRAAISYKGDSGNGS